MNEAYTDCLSMLRQAGTEENMIAAVNGGLEGALQAFGRHASVQDGAIRAELVEIEVDYIRGLIDAFTMARLGKTFRAELEAIPS